jgi:hypothetical protein
MEREEIAALPGADATVAAIMCPPLSKGGAPFAPSHTALQYELCSAAELLLLI